MIQWAEMLHQITFCPSLLRKPFETDKIKIEICLPCPHIFPLQPLYTVSAAKGGISVAIDIEDQYDKIYRYCYFRLKNRERAEDVTQETFLRWFVSDTYRDKNQLLHYLYTVARHLCADESRRPAPLLRPEDVPDREADPLLSIALRAELDKLPPEDRELVLLRCVNGEPMAVLCKLYGKSRFALRRRLNGILKLLRDALE